MKGIWEVIGSVIVTAMAIYLLIAMVTPYVPYLLVALALVVTARSAVRYYRRW